MRCFITDDDPAVRSMLGQIIEDADIGEVVGEADDGSKVDPTLLAVKQVDILLIDLLMPVRDGIETVRAVAPSFDGKIIMISQVESKEMIGEAYSLGIEYYITKPVNRLEVIAVMQKVAERMMLQRSIRNIQQTLNSIGMPQPGGGKEPAPRKNDISTAGNYLLSELGMIGESGSKDLLDILESVYQYEQQNGLEQGFPPLNEIFHRAAAAKLGPAAASADLKKEIKASEQRVRRAINQSLIHLATLGLIDYANPKFEQYATKFFDLAEIRKKMRDIEDHEEASPSAVRINAKKFIQVLYLESRRLMGQV
ncbi:response regulator [Paenibacillus sp. NPDC056579]|uniref:response regulator n=1 Tax=unclassified Paenibacillus TaxID=185978 RepID=UPI001EF83F3A|nr:response regulator [Paenibacillus sp. H1-7]ULL13718.1 response regulator [Paenibacillus sp. H1-7]